MTSSPRPYRSCASAVSTSMRWSGPSKKKWRRTTRLGGSAMTALEKLESFICFHAGQLTFRFGTYLCCNGELLLTLHDPDERGVDQRYTFSVGGCQNVEEAAEKLWESLQLWLTHNSLPEIWSAFDPREHAW